MREQYMRTGEGFLLVYSITSRQSYEEILTFQQQILRVKDKDYFPIIIVGNKCDLDSEREVSRQGASPQAISSLLSPEHGQTNMESSNTDHCRLILPCGTEGENLAHQFGCAFIETSAKSRINVDNAFYNIVREIRKYNKGSFPPTKTDQGSSPGHAVQGPTEPSPGCCGGKCVVM